MKFSTLKFPGLFDCFLIFCLILINLLAGISLLMPSLQHLVGATSFTTFRTHGIGWLHWLCWFGVLCHVLSYFKALRIPALMLANILGIGSCLWFIFLPNWFVFPTILLIITVYLFLATIKNQKHFKATHRTGVSL